MKITSQSKYERAAQLIAEARYDYGKIAEMMGVTVRTLLVWRKAPEFSARVSDLEREFSAAALKRGIARKDYRLKNLADIHSKLLTVIEERAADPKMEHVPGGRTGLVCLQIRAVGTGALQKLMPEFVVDTALIRELRAIQEADAKELGQIVERQQVEVIDLRTATDDQLRRYYEQLTGRPALGAGAGDS